MAQKSKREKSLTTGAAEVTGIGHTHKKMGGNFEKKLAERHVLSMTQSPMARLNGSRFDPPPPARLFFDARPLALLPVTGLRTQAAKQDRCPTPRTAEQTWFREGTMLTAT